MALLTTRSFVWCVFCAAIACFVVQVNVNAQTPPSPRVNSLRPSTGIQGTTVNVTLTGTDFYAPLILSGLNGITFSNIELVSSTMVTATATIANNSPTGFQQVTLTTPSGSGGSSILVTPPPPTLSGITPNFAGASTPHQTVTFTGTHFVSGMTINVDEGIQFSNLQVLNDTTATSAFLSIFLAVPPGLHNVSVSTSAGPSNSIPFVIRPYPTLTGLSPNHALPGTSATINLTGTNFEAGMSFTPGAGITVGSLTVVNTTSAVAQLDLASNASPGLRDFSVLTTGGTSAGTSNQIPFTVDAITTLSSISPGSGDPGNAYSVTLTGTNFSAPMTISTPNGIAVSNVVVTSTATATATFTLASAPGNNALGSRNITVTDPGGTSNAVTFTVNPPPPTLISFSIPFGPFANQGSGGTRTLNGNNFAAGMVVNAGTGITVTNVSVVNSFTANVFFNVSVSAPLGNHDVTVTTAGGTSNAIPFTVFPAITSLSAVSPSSALAGTSVNVTFTGNRLDSSVTITCSGITVSNLQILSATSATATFTIPANASPGSYAIAITSSSSGNGISNISFSVKPPPPTLTSISPTSGFQGAGAQMFLTGTNFVSGMTADAGPGVVIDSFSLSGSPTSASAILSISAAASLGVHNVTFSSAGGTTNALPFVVNIPPAPTFTSLSPTGGNWGSSVSVTLTGTNFLTGMVVNAGPGITVSNLSVASSGSANATFTILSGAPAGIHNVTITNPGGTSNAATFTVGMGQPSITKVSPDSGANNAAINLTLTGARFVPGMTIDVGADITVANVVVTSENSASATIVVSPAAAAGTRSIIVTTVGGTSNTVPFFVGTPPTAVPVIFGIAPNYGARNSSFLVTLNGTNLVGPLSINTGSGINVSNFNVVDSTSATALFSISPAASPGLSSINVSNSSGTSNSVGFYIDTPPPPPVLSAITPTSSIQGATLGVTVSGTSFQSTMSCTVSGDGVAVGAMSITSTTQATTTLSISGSAAVGPRIFTCANAGESSNPVTFTVNSPGLTVSKIGSDNGTVTSNPAGINCGSTCSALFATGEVVSLTAAPAPGSTFGGWSGDPDCIDGVVTMIAALNCVARFDLPQSDSTLLRADYDGDGKTDIVVYRPSTGEWFLRLSTQGYVVTAGNWYFQWGSPGDVPLAGDFDGDRKADIAVYRPTTGEWFLRLSTQGYVVTAGNWYFQWGSPGDVPISGDFDGDLKTDIAVYRPTMGEWFLRLSTQGYAVTAGNWYFQWGTTEDLPVAGDFDGDGKTDIAVYRPSTGEWFLRLSTKGYAITAGNWYYQWGTTGDQPIAGDFDGDGKTDIAVFRPLTGEWFLRLSTRGYVATAGNWYFQWGATGDLPIKGDFDGDATTDIAVFRPSTGEWYLRRSSFGYVFGPLNSFFQWGVPTDLPLRR